MLGKWWEKTGGTVSILPTCGHHWSTPTLEWANDGIVYHSPMPGIDEVPEASWEITSESDLGTFSNQLSRHLLEHLIPWYTRVRSKEGFTQWYTQRRAFIGIALPYILETQGQQAVLSSLCEWLASAPRDIQPQLDWLQAHTPLTPQLAQEIRMASIQAQDTYKTRLPELIQKIKTTTN